MKRSSHSSQEQAINRVNDYVRLAVPADVVSDKIHPGAQLSLLRLAWSPEATQRAVGVHLIGAIKNSVISRITPADEVEGAVLAQETDGAYVVDFDRKLTWNVPLLDEALYSAGRSNIDHLTNASVLALESNVTYAVNPWLCAAVCAGCAAAILDGVPGDEIPACLLCINVCSAGSGLASTEPDPVFLKA